MGAWPQTPFLSLRTARKYGVNCVRFTLPVQDASEVAVLKAHGADELYCGYLDSAWRQLYGGDATISRRQGRANIASPEALAELVQEARLRCVPVHLALNARVTGEQLPRLVRIAERWAALGGDGIILQDPELLRRLKDLKPLIFTASLLAVTVNCCGAAFWQALGADRIVLPRFLSFSDMEAVHRAAPGITCEAMVMGDRCPFVDGFCRSVHAESFAPASPGEIPTAQMETCHTSGCAYHLCQDYFEPAADPCAACSLPQMEAAGVAIGKLGGRGLPLEIRLRWLDFLRFALACESPSRIAGRYQEVFGHGCACYYPGEVNAP